MLGVCRERSHDAAWSAQSSPCVSIQLVTLSQSSPHTTMIAFVAAVTALLLPPRVIGPVPAHNAVELEVPVSEHLSVSILEADMARQDVLVEAALDDGAPRGSAAEDPYGIVIWPAGQVVAAALVQALEACTRPCNVLELGAGTGLVSIAAAMSGANVLATDYRDEPFELLKASATRTAERLGRVEPLPLNCALFDVTNEGSALPDLGSSPLFVCAADLLYMKSTAIALASRCVEALQMPAIRAVLVGDLGRPGRAAFLAELQRLGVMAERAHFESVLGWVSPSPRNTLISSRGVGEPVAVGLLILTPADLRSDGIGLRSVV